MAQNKLLKRSEVPVEYTWNLADMFVSDEDWLKECEALKEVGSQLASFQGKLGESAEQLLAYYRLVDSITLRVGKLRCYASQKCDEDTTNSKYLDFRGKAMSAMVGIFAASAFADTEIMSIPEESLQAFYKECPELKRYRRNIEKIRRRAAHILSAAEEKILASSEKMSMASSTIAGALRDADLKWPKVKDAKGNEYPLSNGSFVPLLESEDRVLRENAFKAYYQQMDAHKNTIAATLDGQFNQLMFYANLRKYGSTLEAALDENEVPTDVYHNLIEAVHQNFDKMYHYVRLRKKMLNVDELHMYDVYTPIVKDVAVEVPYNQAKETVLEALKVLGDDYVDILKEGFANRWVDVYENEGKRGGAYSTGGNPHPYVLLNYNNTLDNMFTLAHEMGHSLHTYYSVKNQPVNTARYVIFVAEVASTCNEVLLTKYLLGKTTDKNQRIYLINHMLDTFKGTLYRQTMFAEFERTMGQLAESGQSLTADLLCQKYHELNEAYFGPDMISDQEIALEWARIPHFFYNYYVFQYATGFSAAVAIANKIMEEGESAVKAYKQFLSSGGSQDPISLLKIAGVDMSTPDPVNSALAYFGELIDELEELTR